MATFGYTGIDATSNSSFQTDEGNSGLYTLNETGLVSKITWRVMGGSVIQNVKGAIYAADGPALVNAPTRYRPGTLKGVTQPSQIAATTDPQTIDLTFAAAISLAAGDYWLMIITEDNGGVKARTHYTWRGDYINPQLSAFSVGYTSPAGTAPTTGGLEQYGDGNVYATYFTAPVLSVAQVGADIVVSWA